LKVGGTPYESGADIIEAILSAARCQQRKLDLVHIFSHSGFDGVYGRPWDIGLLPVVQPAARALGARSVTDIPTDALADNVTFVLHGCSTAETTDNVARALYRHLSSKLGNPRVFGHFTGVCASQDRNWREYSKRSPDGQVRLRSLVPLGLYEEGDGCGKS
jgi:hypothetical protein